MLAQNVIAQEPPQERLNSVLLAQSSVVVEEAVWPSKPRYRYYGSNCVSTLRNAGINVPRALDGARAVTIPTVGKEIAEGQTKVAITYEGGSFGHAVAVKKIDGKLISVVEGGYINGVGREINPAVLKGFTE